MLRIIILTWPEFSKKGEISPGAPGRYTCNGIANVQDDSSIKVTELPVRLWTDNFKDYLEVCRDPKDNKKPDINIIVCI